MARWGVGNQLTTSGNHLQSFASAENPIHVSVGLVEGKVNAASLRDPGDSCQTFAGLDILVLPAHFEYLFFDQHGEEGSRVLEKEKEEVRWGGSHSLPWTLWPRLDLHLRQVT